MHCSGAAFQIYPTIFCPLHAVSERGVARNCTADIQDLPCGFGPFCVFSPRKRIPKLPLLHCKTHRFRMQNAPFWNAKCTVLECKMHHFRMPTMPIGLKMPLFCLRMGLFTSMKWAILNDFSFLSMFFVHAFNNTPMPASTCHSLCFCVWNPCYSPCFCVYLHRYSLLICDKRAKKHV